MKTASSRLMIALGLFLAACLSWQVPAGAQTLSGEVRNNSLWRENLQAPPGDGDHNGQLLIGLWAIEGGVRSTLVAPPASLTNGPLPVAYGPYAFSISGMSTGTYQLIAWIDGDMNNDLDPGEPYGDALVSYSGSAIGGLTIDLLDSKDGDSLPDWWEYHWFRFTPQPFGQSDNGDPDSDGLSNKQELDISLLTPGMQKLDPSRWDTDEDGIDDLWELTYYSKEYSMGCDPTQHDSWSDIDGDGLSNWQEYCGIDRYPPMEFLQFVGGIHKGKQNATGDDLNPLDIDTDFDMLLDSFEAAWYDPDNGINPKDGPLDTTIPEGTNTTLEVAIADSDQDGLSNYREQCLLMELREGQANGQMWNWSGRVPFVQRTFYNVSGTVIRECSMRGGPLLLGLDPTEVIAWNRDALRAHEWTDPTDGTGYDYVDEPASIGHDTDDDWLPDGWEVEFNLDARDNGLGGNWDEGLLGDPDEDGILNIEEYFGQDGYRFTTLPCINGTGDETNPNTHAHRPDSTYHWRWYPTDLLINPITSPRTGHGANRNETLGGALPTAPLDLFPDNGWDSDDDGLSDIEEVSPSVPGRKISSPVHSCDPFIPRSILITSSNGIAIPDPEPAFTNGMAPAGSREDLQRRDWTLECYVKLLSTNLTGDLLSFRTAAGKIARTIYSLSLSNNAPSIISHNIGGSLKTVSFNPLPTNRWIHLAAVWDHANNSLGLYVGGIQYIATSPVGECFSSFMFPATNTLLLAASPNNSFTNLMLDEVRIWGVARSSSQIAGFANRLIPPRNGDDAWINQQSSDYYAHEDSVIVNGGSLFDGEPGTPLDNVCQKSGNYWIDNGDNKYNATIDTLLQRDASLKEGITGTRISNVYWNDKDGSGSFSRDSLLAYYRFDDGGASAEDFARKAKSGLLGAASEEYQFGDFGYALPTNNFIWITNDTPPVYGVDKRGADDADGDGMPDAWEMLWHLDPWENGTRNETVPGMQDGPGGPFADNDGDGLQNLYEFWAGTNPRAKDSDTDGTFDSQEDRDGDGVLNLIEQKLRSRPDMIDTDDDSYPDNIEVGLNTSPAEPASPSVSRAIFLGGAPDDYLDVPLSSRQSIQDWTLEAWVNPSNAVDGAGIIVRRSIQTLTNGMAVNYVMGLETNAASLRLYAGYIWPDGRRFLLSGGNVPATGSWTHVAARYNSYAGQLNLYTNGSLAASTNTFSDAPIVSGLGGDVFLRIGEDFAGALDEIRLWTTVLDENTILNGYNRVVDSDDLNKLAFYFRFDDAEANTNLFGWSEFHQPGGFQDFTYEADWNAQWRHAARARRHGSVQSVTNGAIIPPPSLRVMLAPEAALAAGAQWMVDGVGAWMNSGETRLGLTPGEHSLSFKSIPGWVEPPEETIILTNGIATTLTYTYQLSASITVSIEPIDARTLGATWRIDAGNWNSSGATVSNLTPGAHTLEFSGIPGWATPPMETIVLSSGEHLPVTRRYSIVTGSISSFLSPSDAIAEGAQWRVNNGTWMNSGEVVTNLALTTYTVEFRSIPMWYAPSSVSVSLSNQTTVIVTGSYMRVTGLYVTIQPPAAVAEGALWRLDGGAWTNGGITRELSPGTYTVSFSTLDGWLTPASVSAVVASQSMTTVVGTYYRLEIFGDAPGSTPGRFDTPRSIALDKHHNIYVADTMNDRIQKYDSLTRLWTNWGSYGTNLGKFDKPGGIAVDNAGNIFVADSNNDRIQKRSAVNGQWSSWGTYGTNIGRFNGPGDLALDANGNLYVADLVNDRVQKMTTNGNWSLFIAPISQGGHLRLPKGILVDPSGYVYVSDDGTQTNGTSRVQKFSAAGAFLELIGSSQPSLGSLKRPGGLASGLTNLYVADIDNSRVTATSTNGSWNTIAGSNLLNRAEDVVWDPRGFLLIADTGNDRILRMPIIPGVETNVSPPFAGVMNPGPGTNASFTITWYGILNWYYAVEYANSLTSSWRVLPGCTNIPGNNSVTNVVDYSIGGVTSRFYRVLAY